MTFFRKISFFIVSLLFATSVYAANIVNLSPGYYPLSSSGRPISMGYIYVGNVDTDPEILANQKTLSVLQEDNTTVVVSQPIRTNAGGVPVYDGSPVTLLVTGEYSLKVLDSYGTQVYYVPSTTSYLTETDLPSILGTAAYVDVGTGATEVPQNSDLGSAAYKDTGTASGNVVELGATGLPAVSGESLTDLDATQIADGSVSNTEFQYLNGVSSAIQTQLNNAGIYNGYACFNETQPSGTNAGAAAATTRNVRTLNTTIANNITGCTLSSFIITLPAGSYRVFASAPAHDGVSGHHLIWRNTADSSDTLIGISKYQASSTNGTAVLHGRFTIAAEKTFQLLHYTTSAVATYGLGYRVNEAGTSEVYATIEIWKER